MPYVPVDINSIELDPPAKKYDLKTKVGKDAAVLDLYGDEPAKPVVLSDEKPAYVPVDITKIKMDAPAEEPSMAGDVAKSALYRGVPEGLAAATVGGLGLNAVRGISDLTRWAGDKAAGAILGEEIPQSTENPVPTSSDVLQGLKKSITGTGLYEPKTIPGEYANTVAQFATGAKATGLPVTGAIPAAVVSETAGQATKDTPYEVPARLVGAVAGGAIVPGARSLLNRPKPAQITADEIKGLSTAAYQRADQLGGQLTPQFTDKFLNQIQQASPQTAAGKVFAGETPITKLIDRAKNLSGKPLSLAEAQEIDEHLGDVVDGLLDSGRMTKQAGKVLDVQATFRDMIENAGAGDVVGSKDGFDALKEGRSLWSKQAKLRDIEKIITRAELMDNPATAIKTGFRTLASNPKRLRGFSDTEKELIRKAADSGAPADLLRTVLGSRLNPILGMAGGGLGGAAAAQASSMASRSLATKIQLNKAQKVANTIAGNKPAPAKVPIPYRKNMPLSAIIGQVARP